MDPLLQLLKRLSDHQVEYVLIGGMAAIFHGSPLMTQDVDVCAPMTDENLRRIHAAMHGLDARFRMRPDRMPLWDDPARLHGFKNLNLLTTLGVIDILGEVSGVGTFDDVRDKIVGVDVGGFRCPVLDLDTLIRSKKAAGRPKDQVGVRHLEAIKKTRAKQTGPD
jgi:hypothetical protein